MSRAPTLPEIRAAMEQATLRGLRHTIDQPERWAESVGLSEEDCAEMHVAMMRLGAEPDGRFLVWVVASCAHELGADYDDATDLWQQVGRLIESFVADGMPGGLLQ
jgi:hypothetical protein